MKVANPGIRVRFEDTQDDQQYSMIIDLGSEESKDQPNQQYHKGEFRFFGSLGTNSRKANLLLFSPVSGRSFRYEFDAESEWWRCTEDGHLLQEFFVREIMRVCEGFPNL
jgi:hypothetical protein